MIDYKTAVLFFAVTIPCTFILSVMLVALMNKFGEFLAKQREEKLAALCNELELNRQIAETKKTILSMDKSMRLN
jgi:hypothetical protein